MLTARLLLCVTVLASSLGYAQPLTEPGAAPSEPSLTPPPLVPAPEEPEPTPPPGESIPYRYRPSVQEQTPARRIFFEALAGTGTGLAAGVAGALSGVLVVGDNCTTLACAIPVIGSMSLGIILGTPLGVYGVGHVMGARGSFLAALSGTAVGTLVGVGLAIVFSEIGSNGLGLVTLVSGPVTGAILGYELSVPGPQPMPLMPVSSDSSESGFQCVPTFAVTPAGGLLGGLAGRF